MHWLRLTLIAILIICLVTLGQPRQTANNSLAEIEPGRSFSFGVGKGSTNCNGRVPEVRLPKSSLIAAELALIVNDQDPQSVAVASYYQRQRRIPPENIVHIQLQPGLDQIDPITFTSIKSEIDRSLGPNIQAIALSFSQPFRVGCMGITSALALGYDRNYCDQQKNTGGCRAPQPIPSYNADSVAPFKDLGIRPAMILAGADLAQVKQLIDRGKLSDAAFPRAVGHLLTTTDRDRSVRAGKFSFLAATWNPSSGWTQLNNGPPAGLDFITQADQVLFYFTGLAHVPLIETNRYLPGAIADHLTSLGGVLFGSPQMSILNWLKAGVTASYGTVVEPCNFTAKFPDPEIVVRNYYQGQTALEAYWKSVASPQEGVFVGEPLAKPMGVKQTRKRDQLSVKLSTLDFRKTYRVYAADSPDGPYLPVSEPIRLPSPQVVQMNFGCDQLYYKLMEVQEHSES